jgi:hypothetical protein
MGEKRDATFHPRVLRHRFRPRGIPSRNYNYTKNETNVQKQANGTYLIDSNGDGKWDYTFDAKKGLSPYRQPKTPGFDIVLLIGVFIVSVICGIIVIVVFWKKKRIV